MPAPAWLRTPNTQKPSAQPLSSPHPVTAGFAMQRHPRRSPVWGDVSQRSTHLTAALLPPDMRTERYQPCKTFPPLPGALAFLQRISGSFTNTPAELLFISPVRYPS